MELTQQILSIFSDRGISYSEKRKSVVLDCPNPSCSKEEHCWMKKETGQSICFKCGTTWSGKGLVAAVLKISISEAVRLIYGRDTGDAIEHIPEKDQSLFVPLNPQQNKELEEPELKPIYLTPDFVPVQNIDRAISYLKSRGIVDKDQLNKYSIKYQALVDAVIFPISLNGKVYGWQGRAIPPIAEGRLRLVNSTGFNKSRFLLNYDRAKTADRIILVEGPFDCLHVDIEGFGAVCSFGKTVSPHQIKLLLDTQASEILIGLDKDAAEEVYDLSEALCKTKKVSRILPPAHRKDFGECSREEVLEAIRNATECAGFQASRLEVYFKE